MELLTFSLHEDALIVRCHLQDPKRAGAALVAEYEKEQKGNPNLKKNVDLLRSSGLLDLRKAQLRQNTRYWEALIFYINHSHKNIKLNMEEEFDVEELEFYETSQKAPYISNQMALDAMLNEYTRQQDTLLQQRNAEIERCSRLTHRDMEAELDYFTSCFESLKQQTLKALADLTSDLSDRAQLFFEDQNIQCNDALNRVEKYKLEALQLDKKIAELTTLKQNIFNTQTLIPLLCCAKALKAERFVKACMQCIAENITDPHIAGTDQLIECDLVTESEHRLILQFTSNQDLEKILELQELNQFKTVPAQIVRDEVALRRQQLVDSLQRNGGETYSFVGEVERHSDFEAVDKGRIERTNGIDYVVYFGAFLSHLSFVIETENDRKPYNFITRIHLIGDGQLRLGLETNDGKSLNLTQDGILWYGEQSEDMMLRLCEGDEIQFLVRKQQVELFYNERFIESQLVLPSSTAWFKWSVQARAINGLGVHLSMEINSERARQWVDIQ